MDAKSIIIYSTPTCSFCRMLKSYLTEKGVSYSEVDVAADHEQASHMIELSGQSGVPVMTINEGKPDQEFVVGFNKPRVNQLLGIA